MQYFSRVIYELSTEELEKEGMPYFDIYLRADQLLKHPNILANWSLPTAYYFKIALWLVCYLWQNRDNFTRDFYHNYFDAPKNKNWVIYTDELLLINSITYQIICQKFPSDSSFNENVGCQYRKIINWFTNKEYHNAELVWHAMAGKKISPKSYNLPQPINVYIENQINQNCQQFAHVENSTFQNSSL